MKPNPILRFVPRALAVAALCLAAPAFANPELMGTWRMDLERSEAMQGGLKIDNTYTLEAQGDDVKVRRTFYQGGQSTGVDWTFVTDGKPHEIPGLREPRLARTKWKKQKLNVSYTLSIDTPRGEFNLDVTETWLLNKAGELEIRYVTRTPRGPQNRVEIYVREPGSAER
ncbi:MAG: hypothetical protein AAGK22_17200 [Acidobacteriota bacterium]